MSKDFSEIFKLKKEAKKKFFKEHKIPKNKRAVVVNLLKNQHIKKSITDACNQVDIFVLEKLDDVDFLGIDAIIFSDMDQNFKKNISDNLIIPITLKGKNNSFSEFNPMKFQGNSFLFDKEEVFCIFEKISRMLENSQYSGDRRMLLKNIFSINNSI